MLNENCHGNRYLITENKNRFKITVNDFMFSKFREITGFWP